MALSILWLILTLLGCLALLVLGCAYVMARMLLQPPRMSDGKAAWVLKRLSPGDLGLAFETLWFNIRDERGRPMRLAAWWIPHPNALGRCAMFIHGYADAKVGAIAWAPTFHSLGWNILAPDLRAHGESDGRFVTAGILEQHDINQVINQIRSQRPEETRQLVLFGISLGAAIATVTAIGRDDLAAVILDCPSGDESHAAMIQYNLLGMPGRLVQKLALRMAHWISGADFGSIRPIDLIARIPCPLMIIQSGDDVYVPPEDMAAIERAARSRPADKPTVYWRIDDATHLLGVAKDPEQYRQRIGQFLAQYCPVAGSTTVGG